MSSHDPLVVDMNHVSGQVQKGAEKAGVDVSALEAGAAICLHGNECSQRALIFGYSSLTESTIQKGITLLSEALKAST